MDIDIAGSGRVSFPPIHHTHSLSPYRVKKSNFKYQRNEFKYANAKRDKRATFLCKIGKTFLCKGLIADLFGQPSCQSSHASAGSTTRKQIQIHAIQILTCPSPLSLSHEREIQIRKTRKIQQEKKEEERRERFWKKAGADGIEGCVSWL